MKVCCISAKAQHGKDTAAGLLKEHLESVGQKVLITHYADLVKFICTNYFGWDGKKDEKGRTLLQYIGTDKVGAKDPAYWVNFIVSILEIFDDEWDYVLIPDCRYPVEVTRMAENFDTVVLRVERPGFESGLTEKQKQHRSETSMDDYKFDAVILNDAGLDEFRHKLIGFANMFLID